MERETKRPVVWLVAVAAVLLSGCGLYYERRAEQARADYIKQHTNLPDEIVLGIHDAQPVIGMTVEQLEVALGGDLRVVRTGSDGTSVHEHRQYYSGALAVGNYQPYSSTLYYFEGGALVSWEHWPGL